MPVYPSHSVDAGDGHRPVGAEALHRIPIRQAVLHPDFLKDHNRQSLRHDLKVLRGRAFLDVFEVELDLAPDVFDAGVIPEVDLGQPRNARQHLLPEARTPHLVAQTLKDSRLLRTWPHDIHVALQHVEELRQLVDARGTQDSADASNASVVLRCPLLTGVPSDRHRPKLVDGEYAASEIPCSPTVILSASAGSSTADADTVLGVDRWPSGVEPNEDGDQQHERRSDQNPDRCHHDVDETAVRVRGRVHVTGVSPRSKIRW